MRIEEVIEKRQQEKQRILESFEVYEVPDYVQYVIIEAIDSQDWNWIEMDGCTAVPDYWPTRYNPACLVHDFMWATGRGGAKSDYIFKRLSMIYGMPSGQSTRRYIGVRIFWFLAYKWKHLFNGNKRPITAKQQYCYEQLKRLK